MTPSETLISGLNSLSELIPGLSNQSGGNKTMNVQQNKSSMFFFSFLIILIVLVIKGYIVYIVYNFLVPKLVHSISSITDPVSLENAENNFRKITFGESILLVILFNTLFSF